MNLGFSLDMRATPQLRLTNKGGLNLESFVEPGIQEVFIHTNSYFRENYVHLETQQTVPNENQASILIQIQGAVL